jgi:hypothetical protein
MRVQRLTRLPAWVTVGTLVLVSTAIRGYAGVKVHGPWISPDETVYALLGQSLYRHGSLTILGGPTPFYSLVVPVLVGPFLSLHDLGLGYSLLKPFLALVMSLAAFPVFFWTRSVAGRGGALLAAALTVALPGLAYSGLVMSEVAFYPAMTLAAWAAARAIAAPSRRNALVLGLAVALATATRLQALVLLPVLVAAVGLDAFFARSWARLRATAPMLIGAFVPVVVWLLFQAIRGEPLLGAYESTAAASYHAVDAVRFMLYHAGTFVLTTGVLPVCALLALGIDATVRGEQDPRARATTAMTLALAGGVVVQVGVFASQHVGQIAERDMLCVAPSLLVCFALWLSRAEGRRYATAVVAGAVAFLAVATIPLKTFVTEQALPDAITFAPLWQLERATSTGTLTVVVLVATALVVALFVGLPRRVLVVLPVLLLGAAIAGSVSSSREVIAQAAATRTALGGPVPRWVDRAPAFGRATFVYDGGRDWPEVWQALFWNRRIDHVATFDDAVLPGPAPQSKLDLRSTGRISVHDPLLVTPSTFQAEGSLIALTPQSIPSHGGLRLWELGSTPRIVSRAIGLQANGDIYGNDHATLVVYGCTKGTWILSLLIKGPPQEVVLSQDGHVLQRDRFTTDSWAGRVPITPRLGAQTCRLGITSSYVVGTTRFEFAPA